MIDDYFRWVDELIRRFAPILISEITYDKRSKYVGFIRGELRFFDHSRLHFREYVNVERSVDRYMYVYHYQQSNTSLIFRYDNTPHFPELPNFPHHKHDQQETQVIPVDQPTLETVLTEIKNLLVSSI